jgi:hypothetical protein
MIFLILNAISTIAAYIMLCSLTFGKYSLLMVDISSGVRSNEKEAIFVNDLLNKNFLYKIGAFLLIFWHSTLLSKFTVCVYGFDFHAGAGRLA